MKRHIFKTVLPLVLLGAATILIGSSCGDGGEPCTIKTWYFDNDGDGFGDPEKTTKGCEAPEGYVSDDRDCDDSKENINPNATEVMDNGLDDDCDGTID